MTEQSRFADRVSIAQCGFVPRHFGTPSFLAIELIELELIDELDCGIVCGCGEHTSGHDWDDVLARHRQHQESEHGIVQRHI